MTGSPDLAGATPGGVSPDDAWAFRLIFGVGALLGLVSLAFTFFVRESEHPAPSGQAGAPPETHDAPPLPRAYWRTVSVLLVFALANSSDAFLLLRATQVGLAPWAVVLAYALYNLTYTVFSYPAGLLSDRLGRWRVVSLGWLVYGAAYAGFAFTNAAGVWPLFALYGVSMALTDGVGKALVTDHAPARRRGTALGIFYLGSGLLALVASLVAGLLWEHVGPSGAFLFGAAGALIGVALVPILRPHR